MADLTTRTVLSICATVSSRLPELAIKNGQLIFVQDKHRIAFDFGGKRKFYNQIEELAKDSDRIELEEPAVGLYYFVIETAVLWTYQESGWVQLTTSPEEIIYIGTDSMPELGSTKTLYVNKKNKEISVWDSGTNQYLVVADKKDAINESDIDLLFV